jgi:hypothetical protein
VKTFKCVSHEQYFHGLGSLVPYMCDASSPRVAVYTRFSYFTRKLSPVLCLSPNNSLVSISIVSMFDFVCLCVTPHDEILFYLIE